ncbi:MAG TPA: energy transducer TonB [Terriglobales bacterium]
MNQAVISQPTSSDSSLASGPLLLIEAEPWRQIFFRNLQESFFPVRQPSLHLSSAPGEFWPDVFVSSHLPWRRIPISTVLHFAAIFAMLAFVKFWPQPAQVITQAKLNSNDVITYSPSEYLPPLDTGGESKPVARHGDPAYAKQPILSVPPEADNRTQTIVAPPDVKLKQDLPMPNVVAWKHAPPAVPIAATENLQSRKAFNLPIDAVAPAPSLTQFASQRTLLSQPAVVAPQPELQANFSRRVDAVNIGHQQVVAPAPQLPMAESHTSSIRSLAAMNAAAPQPNVNLTGQQKQKGVALPQAAAIAPAPSLASTSSMRRYQAALGREQVVAPAPNAAQLEGHTRNQTAFSRTNEAVPPAPSAQSLAAKNNDRQMIALNLHPGVEVAPPQGNRRGTFAATPLGKKDAAGTPDASTATKANSSGAKANTLPPGLHVGNPDNSKQQAISGSGSQGSGSGSATNGHSLVANVTPPRVTSGHPAKEVPDSSATPTERRVFGGHKFYGMAMNFANLNSSGGSWVFHFAELADSEKGDLMAPEVDHQEDPAYPTELMRHNVHGTVVLYALIGSDGSVSNVKVLESVDDQLDEYARRALSQWHFKPASKNGVPVALTMVVRVPFRPSRNAF